MAHILINILAYIHKIVKIRFFLNSIDGYSPKKIQNIIIFKKIKKSLSIIFLLKRLIIFMIKNKASPKKYFINLIFISIFSKFFPHLIKSIKGNIISKIIMFYEAQPYQNNFIHELKKRKIEIETVGFYHLGYFLYILV